MVGSTFYVPSWRAGGDPLARLMAVEGLAGVVGERVGCGGEGFITMPATWHYGGIRR